jgi:hypothetical protein
MAMAQVSVAEITKSLKGINFPVGKDDLIQHARDNGADEEIIEMIEEMPDDEYGSMSDVMSAFGDMQ